MEKWTASDITNGKYLGILEIEYVESPESTESSYTDFGVIETADRLVFGTCCNIGFLESGYMMKDLDFSTDTNLEELIADLEVYYNQGKQYVSNIVCNDRM